MEPLGYSLARWVGGGWEAIEKADKVRTVSTRGVITPQALLYITSQFPHFTLSLTTETPHIGRKALRSVRSEGSMGETGATFQGTCICPFSLCSTSVYFVTHRSSWLPCSQRLLRIVLPTPHCSYTPSS